MVDSPEFLDHASQFHFQQLSSIYGSHLPYRLLMERNLVVGMKRLQALPSSNLSLEILTGHEADLPFPVYLHPDLSDPLPKVEKQTQWLQ